MKHDKRIDSLLDDCAKVYGGPDAILTADRNARLEREIALFDLPMPDYDVTCARCGKVLSCLDAYIEEGDEWECPECWERCEAAERAAITAPKSKGG